MSFRTTEKIAGNAQFARQSRDERFAAIFASSKADLQISDRDSIKRIRILRPPGFINNRRLSFLGSRLEGLLALISVSKATSDREDFDTRPGKCSFISSGRRCSTAILRAKLSSPNASHFLEWLEREKAINCLRDSWKGNTLRCLLSGASS